MSDLHLFQEQFVAAMDSRPALPLSPMAVYCNTSLSGAVQALADNFPVVCELVGEDLFDALAIDHARTEPPSSPVLAHYGKEFPGWLARQPISSELTYLADVARCERLYVETLFAADAPALSLADIAMIGSARLSALRLKLHPATRFDWLATPAMHIWLAHREEMADEIVVDWQPGGALFTCPRHAVVARALCRAEHRLLSGLCLGESLGEAAGSTRALYPETEIGAVFVALVECGAFAAMAERMD